jgi:NAD(P)-dependent dehydrogenase (short-subunit alcohol dehydrogenase family)
VQWNLNNKTAVITGGTKGIGLAIANEFLSLGANVIVIARNEEEIGEKIAAWKLQGYQVQGIAADLTQFDKYDILLDKIGANKIDVLVNNAVVMDDFIPVDRIVNKQWQHIMDVNLNGPFYAMRAVLPIMLKHGKGVILNIASVGGLFGSRAGAAYTASKHVLIGLTKNTGFMYAQKGIRCNAIAPGGVNTHIADSLIPDALGYERCISGASFMPRMGEPEEIAQIAAHLCSDEASFINGAVITADGGWTAY